MKKQRKHLAVKAGDKAYVTLKGASSIAKALKLPDSAVTEWELRSELNERIVELVKKENITHAALAQKAGTSRTRLTALLNKRSEDISLSLMLRVLGALGYKASLNIKRIAS